MADTSTDKGGTSCAICYEAYAKPDRYPFVGAGPDCYHQFCEACILEIGARESDGVVKCPYCREQQAFVPNHAKALELQLGVDKSRRRYVRTIGTRWMCADAILS